MISYNGYDTQMLTMQKSSASMQIGDLVTVNADGYAVTAVSGKPFIGICTAVRGEYVSVQTEGYTQASYTGTAPGYGFVNLVSNGGNAVKVNTDESVAGVFRRVMMVDTESKTVGFIL